MNAEEAIVYRIINLVADDYVVAAAGAAGRGKFVRLARAFVVLAWRYVFCTELACVVKPSAALVYSETIAKYRKNRF